MTTGWNIGLKRSRNQCFTCPPEVQDSIRCYQHTGTKGVLFTYVRGFHFLESTEKAKEWCVNQSIHKEVYCPQDILCDKVIKD